MSDKPIGNPPYEGFDPKYDSEVDKETGCFMKGSYTRPESDWCFLYHDNKCHIWFYADRIWDGPIFDVSVRSFSGEKFYRHGVHLKLAYLPTIKRNLEKCFHERDFLSFSLPRRPTDIFRSVRFDWDPKYRRFLVSADDAPADRGPT